MESETDSDTEYEVEKVIGKRRRKGKMQYLVRWKGFLKEHDTWEPYTNLTSCQNKIKEYNYVQQRLRKHGISRIDPDKFYNKNTSPSKDFTTPQKTFQVPLSESRITTTQAKSPVVSVRRLIPIASPTPSTTRVNSLRTYVAKTARPITLRSGPVKAITKPTQARITPRVVKPIQKASLQKIFTVGTKKNIVENWLESKNSQVKDVVLDHDYLNVDVISTVSHKNTSETESTKNMPATKPRKKPLIPGSIRQQRFLYLSWNPDYVEIIFANTTRGNALTPRFLLEISRALDAVVSSKCTTALLRSVGPIFCLGFDLQAVVDLLSSSPICEETARNLAEAIRNFINKLIDFPKILVAIVQGPCVGLGCSMLSHFDTVYCSERAVFWTPYVEMGLMPDGCSSILFPEILGKSVANNMLLNASKLTAYQAKERGFVTEVFMHDNLQTNALSLICKSANQPCEALETSKSLIKFPNVTKLKHSNYCETKQLMESLSKQGAVDTIKQFLKLHWYG